MKNPLLCPLNPLWSQTRPKDAFKAKIWRFPWRNIKNCTRDTASNASYVISHHCGWDSAVWRSNIHHHICCSVLLTVSHIMCLMHIWCNASVYVNCAPWILSQGQLQSNDTPADPFYPTSVFNSPLIPAPISLPSLSAPRKTSHLRGLTVQIFNSPRGGFHISVNTHTFPLFPQKNLLLNIYTVSLKGIRFPVLTRTKDEKNRAILPTINRVKVYHLTHSFKP